MNSSTTTAAASVPAPALSGLEAVIARRIDFPTWLPAMMVKELRQGLRQRDFVAALVGFQAVMTLFLIFAVAGGSGSTQYNVLEGAFWVVINVQLLGVIPLRALTGLQQEVDSRWVDLLMLTRLTSWRIVLGKWVSLVVQAFLLTLAMLPYGVARYFFGSVNLVREGEMLAFIFTGSAVLIAIGLWCSTLPKLARVVLAGPVILVWSALPDSFAPLQSMGTRAMRYSSGSLVGMNVSLAIFDICILLLFCLIGAVRRLSPRAESQTPLTRLLPLLGFVPLPFLTPADLRGQVMLALFFFVFVAALELGRKEEPLEPHWLPWHRRGFLGRLVGRFVQPGWASAIEWVVIIVAVGGVAAWFAATSRRIPVNLADNIYWGLRTMPLFAVEALIFPVLLFSWLGRRFSQHFFGYMLVFIGMTALSLVATSGGKSFSMTRTIDQLLMLLPVGSFWTTLSATQPPPVPTAALQIGIAVAVLAAAWWRARPYRLQRRVFATAPTENPPS